MALANSTNIYSNSRFIVGATNSPYTTIQSAINAANASGGNATIWVRSGTYTENLTLYDTIDLEGADSALTIINGTHTPPNSGAVSFTRIGLNSATDILNSAAAGTTSIKFSRCVFSLTNGYACNLTNWTGSLYFRYCLENSSSAKNGIVYNTASAPIYVNHSILGIGSNVFTANGNVTIFSVNCACPILLNGAGVSQFLGASNLTGNISTADTHNLKIATCRISTGATQAITHNSATELVLDSTIVGSTNATALGGAGSIKTVNVQFPSSNVIAGTITTSLVGVTRTAEMWSDNITRMTDTGFYSWAAAGPYFDDATLGTFKLLVGGTGYIRGKRVTWVAQHYTGMTAGNCYYIYIDSTGTVGAATSHLDANYQNYIMLFECLRDSTPVTNNQITVAENHPYDFQVGPSNFLHDTVGPVIANTNNGANITLNGTQGIQINGADELYDHGLNTTIPDSGGVAETWIKMYTTGTGKWARQNATNTFTGYYNNAGTPTALSANRYAVYRLYVSKNNLNSALPVYFAVLHTAQFTTTTAANTAISNGTIAGSTNELAALEMAQLGYIIFSQASNSIVQVTISKSTLRSTISSSGTNTASLVTTVVTNFDGVLSSADTNVQAALETIDEFGKNLTDHAVVVGNGNGSPLGVIGVGDTGTLLVGASAADPAFATSAVGDFTFTSATAAQDRTFTISNTDNSAAASAAHLQVTVGGATSTGDPYTNYLVNGAGTYSLGIDNSDSDKLKITTGASPSAGNTLFNLTTAGDLSINDYAVYQPANIQHGEVAVAGDGTYYIMSTAGARGSIYIYTFQGANRVQMVNIDFNAMQFDSSCSLSVTANRAYVSQNMISNIRFVKDGAGGDARYIAVDIGNRNGGTNPLYINYIGSAPVTINPGAPATPTEVGTFGLQQGSIGQLYYYADVITPTIPFSITSTTCTLGSDATERTVTIGNGTGATSVVVDCGTGALNIGTNAIARTTTLGNTTGASALALNCGTGDFTLASATGTIISAIDTGEVTMPLQPAFLAFNSSARNNVTGNGAVYTLIFDTVVFDQNSDFDGTSTFTAPVTGKYYLESKASLGQVTNGTVCSFTIVTSNRSFVMSIISPTAVKDLNNQYMPNGSILCDMDAGDTATITIAITGIGADTADVQGGAAGSATSFSGNLIC